MKPERTDEGAAQVARVSRDLDFPRDSVFRMFTDPRKAATFWGPEGATNLLFEIDPRPGGILRIHDRTPEGVVFKTTGTILEIVAPERLVFRSLTAPGGDSAPFEALQTVTFEPLGPRQTRVTAIVKVLSAGSFPGGPSSLAEGFQGGWGETFDRLRREMR